MIGISGKLLAGIVTVLLAVLAVLGAYHLKVAVAPVEPTLGAVAGNEVQGNEFTVGGATYFMAHCGFISSTSPCMFKTPYASTTPIAIAANVKSIGGAVQLEWGVSNIQGATTTILAHLETVASGQPATFIASSSIANLATITAYSGSGAIGPNAYISLKAGTSSMTTNITGQANIVLLENK